MDIQLRGINKLESKFSQPFKRVNLVYFKAC